MDEEYNKNGVVNGYVWVNLAAVLADARAPPVPGSTSPISPFARGLFEGEGKSRLLSAIMQSIIEVAPTLRGGPPPPLLARQLSLNPLVAPLPVPPRPTLPAGFVAAAGRVAYVMRHAESSANAANASRANAAFRDAQLTELGVRQAAAWRVAASSWGVTKVIVSPLRRAMQTAAIAFATTVGTTFEASRCWRELGWGAMYSRGVPAEELEPWLRRDEVFGGTPNALARLNMATFDSLRVKNEFWDPAGEDALPPAELERREEMVLSYAKDKFHRDAVGKSDIIAIVSHHNTIVRIFGVRLENAEVLRVVCDPRDGAIRSIEKITVVVK